MGKAQKTKKLDAEAGLKSSLREILEKRLDDMFSFQGSVLATSSPESIHDMRVAARRFRALMRIFQAAFPKKKLKDQNRHLSALLKLLGRVRDCDILIERLEADQSRMSPEEWLALEPLLDRQKNSRTLQLSILKNQLDELHSQRYHQQFREFLTESLS